MSADKAPRTLHPFQDNAEIGLLWLFQVGRMLPGPLHCCLAVHSVPPLTLPQPPIPQPPPNPHTTPHPHFTPLQRYPPLRALVLGWRVDMHFLLYAFVALCLSVAWDQARAPA